MNYGISLKIDLKKLEKARLFQGKNGALYLDATVFIDTDNPSKYGDHGFISQSVSKDERESGVKGGILGNATVFYRDDGQQPSAPPSPRAPIDDDSIPF